MKVFRLPNTFQTQRRIEFCETDAAGIAHFSAFVCYMEQAEHAFWRSLGTSIVEDLGEGWHLSWPRVHVECDYRGTARFEQVLDVELNVVKLGEKSITYAFQFSNDQVLVAEGKIVAVCCRVKSGEALQSIPIPAKLRTLLEPFVAQ